MGEYTCTIVESTALEPIELDDKNPEADLENKKRNGELALTPGPRSQIESREFSYVCTRID